MKGYKREFSEEEVNYIIRNWGVETAHSMKKKFNCSWYAIVGVATSHGLEAPKNNSWTDKDIALLKDLSIDTHYEDIAKIMNRTPNAIILKAKRLGLPLIQKRRKWTSDEEEYLVSHWELDAIEDIAKDMRRSVYSIKVKAIRMHLGPMMEANISEINVPTISRVLGVRQERITDTWIKYGLKLKKKKVTENYSYYCVTLGNLLAFLESHQDLWNSCNLEVNTFGPEPDWLTEKRIKDKINPPSEYKRWTDAEVSLAEKLLLGGCDYEFISSKVGHTPKAVAYKLRDIGLSYKLKQYWRGSELKFLKENYMNMTQQEIADVLGRTRKAVGAKMEEMGYQKIKRDKNRGDKK